MDPKLINLATFAAAALTVVGVFSIISDLVLREKARIRDRIRDQFGIDADGRSQQIRSFQGPQSLCDAQTARRAAVLAALVGDGRAIGPAGRAGTNPADCRDGGSGGGPGVHAHAALAGRLAGRIAGSLRRCSTFTSAASADPDAVPAASRSVRAHEPRRQGRADDAGRDVPGRTQLKPPLSGNSPAAASSKTWVCRTKSPCRSWPGAPA